MTSKSLAINPNSIKRSDIPILGICGFGLLYFAYGEPRVMSVFAISIGTAFVTLKSIEFVLKKLFNRKSNLQVAHYLTIALAISLCFTTLEAPSHALFDALETAAITILDATGDSGIEEESIAALFTFFRLVVILAFVGGAITGVTQALQGSDWRPIANMMGIGVGLVLAVEVLTNLVLPAV